MVIDIEIIMMMIMIMIAMIIVKIIIKVIAIIILFLIIIITINVTKCMLNCASFRFYNRKIVIESDIQERFGVGIDDMKRMMKLEIMNTDNED